MSDLDLVDREPWRKDALCQQVGHPELWFPETGESAEPAKSVCRNCPVRQLCLQFALDRREIHGVWGGATEPERRALRGEEPRTPGRRGTHCLHGHPWTDDNTRIDGDGYRRCRECDRIRQKARHARERRSAA